MPGVDDVRVKGPCWLIFGEGGKEPALHPTVRDGVIHWYAPDWEHLQPCTRAEMMMDSTGDLALDVDMDGLGNARFYPVAAMTDDMVAATGEAVGYPDPTRGILADVITTLCQVSSEE